MPPLLTPVDLAPFAKIEPTKAQAMIDDAIALAETHAPCLAGDELEPSKARAARAIIRGAILRWHEAGAGAAVTKTAGIYGQTVDTRQPRKGMFFPSEIDQLKQLCRTADDDRGAFSFSMLPPVPLLSAQQEFERDLDTTW